MQATNLRIDAYYPHLVLSLSIRGDGCGLNWDSGLKMTKTSENQFSIDLTCDTSIETLQTKVLIEDSLWMIGSNHFVDVKNASNTKMYPYFFTTQGQTQIIQDVYSEQFDNKRSVIVYTPPSYVENPLKVHKNVLIMHDG